MFLYRQEVYDGPTDKDGNSLEGRAEIIVGKQRNGPTGIVNLYFHKTLHALRESLAPPNALVSPKAKTVYRCTDCGADHPKWAGRCDACGEWNTLVEEMATSRAAATASGRRVAGSEVDGRGRQRRADSAPSRHQELRGPPTGRPASGEFDFVLGGGIVPGSMVLVGGEPGIGKSTLLLQVAGRLQAARPLDALRRPARNRRSRSSCAPTGCDGSRGRCRAAQRDASSRRSSPPPARSGPTRSSSIRSRRSSPAISRARPATSGRCASAPRD